MSSRTFTPTPEQLAAANPSKNVWVAANAGSGKTHVLVERVIRLLLAGADPSAILCITYTKAAAAEMSGRLFEKLGGWTALEDDALLGELQRLGVAELTSEYLVSARRLFTRALETPGGLKIQTIHAFCEKLLHLFPVEAGLAPGFEVLDERRDAELRELAIIEVLQKAEGNPDSELGIAFASVVAHVNADQFNGLISEFLGAAKGLRSLLGSGLRAEGFESALKSSLQLELNSSPKTVAQEISQIDRAAYAHHANVLAGFKKHGLHDTVAHMRTLTTATNTVEASRTLFLTQAQTPRGSLMAKATGQAHPSTLHFMEHEQQRIFSLLTAHDLHLRIAATSALFKIAQAVFNIIEAQKRRKGLYDFDDLISRTAKLLNNARAAQWVLYKLDAGLQHVLVDEAQDTSQAQWQIITALTQEFFSGAGRPSASQRTLFAVGDRKQSIYSFQGADALAFSMAQRDFKTQISAYGDVFNTIDLNISYRSVQTILDAVDLVFPPTNKLQLGFSESDREERTHQSYRIGAPGVVEVWPLYEPLEKDDDEPWSAPVDREERNSPRRRLAKDIAITIKNWLGKRIIAARGRVVCSDDILILLQTRGPLFSMLISELRRANVPVAGADRLKLRDSLAVQDLLILAQFMVLPQDDHALACLLKSPLLEDVFNEDRLFALAHNRGAASLWSLLESHSLINYQRLAQWQSLSEVRGPYDFFATVLISTRKLILSRLGSEAEDATDAFLDAALEYEQLYGPSLAGFLHWFTATETIIKREMEKNSGEVRLMTVHGAKGLEANIVFLPDAASMPSASKHSKLLRIPDGEQAAGAPLWRISGLTAPPLLDQWLDLEKIKTQQERNRLLYVAMTRACDELYICGSKSDNNIPDDCWYNIVEKALGSPDENDQLRFGAPYTYHDPEAEHATEKKVLAQWVSTNPATEVNNRTHSLTGLIKRHGPEARNYDPTSARRGIAIHNLLQELPDRPADKREAFALRKAKRLGLAEGEAMALVRLINMPELASFFGSESQAEVELRGRLEDGRIVSGRVDRIAILPTEILLLDYKSDHFAPESLGVDHPYVQQLSLYAEILETAYPERNVKAALLWTQTARLDWISPDLMPEARERALAQLEPDTP